MRCYIHILTDNERIVDPDGEEFADLEAARAEASQSARDLMAEELMAGRPVPFGWRAQVADSEGAILLTISFAGLVFGSEQPLAGFAFPPVRNAELVARVREARMSVRTNHGEIKSGIKELWSNLHTLAKMNAALNRALD